MQLHTTQFDNALLYSHSPMDRVDVYRGGASRGSDLQIQGGSINISGGNGQIVRKSISGLQVVDSSGDLVPIQLDSALAPFGSELKVQMGIHIGNKTEMMLMGWFPIKKVDIEEQSGYVIRPDEPSRKIWYSRGAVMTLDCEDPMKYIETNKFIAREQPSQASVLAEVKYLLSDNKPAFGGVIGTVNDKPVSKTITYDLDRLKALLDLADTLNVDIIADEQGLIRFKSRVESPSVWRLDGSQFSILNKTKRSITSDGVYNGGIEKSTADDERPLQAIRVVTEGPLVWGGPYGKVGFQHSSALLTTQAEVDAGALTTYNKAIQIQPQKIPVECVRNTALQWGDYVDLPTRTGYVKCRITELNFPFGVSTMTMTVEANPFKLGGLL